MFSHPNTQTNIHTIIQEKRVVANLTLWNISSLGLFGGERSNKGEEQENPKIFKPFTS